MSDTDCVTFNGWSLFAHPLFLDQMQDLRDRVERLREKYPKTYQKKNATKRLTALSKLVFDIIPQDPTCHKYRQDNILDSGRKYWLQAGFFKHHKLFFRYHSESRIILYAWVKNTASK